MIYFIAAWLMTFAMAAAAIFLAYWTPNAFGYPKTGKLLAYIVSSAFGIFLLFTIFEDQLFFKSDARKLLQLQDITLNDPFQLEGNQSMSAIGEYYHTFTLTISAGDKARLIDQIRKAQIDEAAKHVEDMPEDKLDRYNGPRRIKNYETDQQLVRELFQPNGEGYAPTWHKIEIDKVGNKLIFEDRDD